MTKIENSSRSIESEAETEVSEWIRSRNSDSIKLKKDLLHKIQHKTFNSAVLMRLYTTVLIYDDNLVESKASFGTYIKLQKLALIKSKSGAKSSPDSNEKAAQLIVQMLSYLDGFGAAEFPTIINIGNEVEDLLASANVVDISHFNPIFARVSVVKALLAEDDNTWDTECKSAEKYFSEVNEAQWDADLLFAHAQFLVLTEGTAKSFPVASRALQQNPNNVRCALLVAKLMSADGQWDSSIKLAQTYWDRNLVPTRTVDRATLIELKKTSIGNIELTKGTEAAMAELIDFIELVSRLFDLGVMESTESKKTPDHHASGRRFFIFRRRTTSVVNNTKGVVNGQTNEHTNGHTNGHVKNVNGQSSANALTAKPQNLKLEHARIVAFSWFWISQQYAKSGFSAEAREALDVGGSVLHPTDLKGHAELHAAQAQIDIKQSPSVAISRFKEALALEPLNMTATLGTAHILGGAITGAASENVESNVSTSASVADNNNGEFHDLEDIVGHSTILKGVCSRSPGRFVPEAWFARGLLHEKLGELDEARKMYWHSINLDERRGVSSFIPIV